MDEDDEDEDDDEDEEEMFDEDPELPSDLSDDDNDDADLDGLDAFVDKLTSADKKRKAEDEPVAGKKRRVLPVMSAPGVGEGDLALKSSKLEHFHTS